MKRSILAICTTSVGFVYFERPEKRTIISPRVYFSFRSAQLSCFLVQGDDELRLRFEWAIGAPLLIVLLARSDAPVNCATLRRRVLVICWRKLRKDDDHATRNFNLDFLPASKSGPPKGSQRNRDRLLAFDSDGYGNGYRRKLSELHPHDSRFG
jgi:hypothetical protein